MRDRALVNWTVARIACKAACECVTDWHSESVDERLLQRVRQRCNQLFLQFVEDAREQFVGDEVRERFEQGDFEIRSDVSSQCVYVESRGEAIMSAGWTVT